MIVRELIAALGIDFDRKGADQADDRLKRLKSTMSTVAGVFSFGLVTKGLHSLVTAASDVEETLNVVRATFKDSAPDVLDWAKKTGDAMGRSQYSMREMAGQFGAFLMPTQKNTKSVAEMSKGLAGLAVDLASFYNMTDEEAFTKLASGMAGESEAIKTLGVDLKVGAMEEFLHAKGINKKWKELTQAQKQTYFYNKILEDTIDKQGDAIKTSQGFANSSKRLKENLRDLAVALGQQLMGPAGMVVGWFSDMAKGFQEMAGKSGIAESALLMLGTLAAVLAAGLLAANAGAAMFVAGLGLITVAINDIKVALDGGKSVIGDFFTALIGKRSWDQVRETWKKGMEDLGNFMYDATHPDEAAKRKKLGLKGSPTALDTVSRWLGGDPNKARKTFRDARAREQAEADAEASTEATRQIKQAEYDASRATPEWKLNPAAAAAANQWREVLQSTRTQMAERDAENPLGLKLRVDPTRHMLNGIGSSLKSGWEGYSGAMQSFSRWKQENITGTGSVINNTEVNLYGPATPDAGRDIARRVQKAHEDAARNLHQGVPVAPAPRGR